jgi:hypothetical protein
MGKQSEIKIIIEAVDKATGNLQKVGKGLGNLGSAAGLALGAVAGAVAGIATATFKLAESAAPVAGIKSAFEGLTESIEGGSSAMLEAMEDASYGMIKQSDLMKSFNLASQLVSKDFAQTLPDSMRYLAKVSAATGEDLSFLSDSLVRGIGRLSPMILDNLGIQVDLTKAYEDYAEANGLVVANLTKTEQQAALTNQVMELLAQNTADMPEIAGTFAQSWAQVKTEFANLKDEIGLRLLPMFNTLTTKISEWFNSPEVQESLDKFYGWLEKIIGEEDTGIIGIINALSGGDFEGALKAAFGENAHEILAGFGIDLDNVNEDMDRFKERWGFTWDDVVESIEGTILNAKIGIANLKVFAAEIKLIVVSVFEGLQYNLDIMSIRIQNDTNRILGFINNIISAINTISLIKIAEIKIPNINVPYPEALLGIKTKEAYAEYMEAVNWLGSLTASGGRQMGGQADVPGFASGGSFIVPGTGRGDRPYTVPLEPGEKVTVSPRGQFGEGLMNLTIQINTPVNLADRAFVEREFAPIIRTTVRQVLSGA